VVEGLAVEGLVVVGVVEAIVDPSVDAPTTGVVPSEDGLVEVVLGLLMYDPSSAVLLVVLVVVVSKLLAVLLVLGVVLVYDPEVVAALPDTGTPKLSASPLQLAATSCPDADIVTSAQLANTWSPA